MKAESMCDLLVGARDGALDCLFGEIGRDTDGAFPCLGEDGRNRLEVASDSHRRMRMPATMYLEPSSIGVGPSALSIRTRYGPVASLMRHTVATPTAILVKGYCGFATRS